MKEKIENYLKEQFRCYRVHLISSLEKNNTGHIHDFRVALKRIRAIANFTGKINRSAIPENYFRIYHFNRIFKAGGRLREIHINMELLKQYKPDMKNQTKVVSDYLKYKELRTEKKLARARKMFSYRKMQEYFWKLNSMVHQISEEKLPGAIDDFISNDIYQIESLILDYHVESKLHNIRKLIKRIKYLLDMAGIIEKSYGRLNFSVQNITILEDRIGYWHDIFVFRKLLYKILNSPRWNLSNGKQIESLKQEVDQTYEQLFRETVESIYRDFKINEKSDSLL